MMIRQGILLTLTMALLAGCATAQSSPAANTEVADRNAPAAVSLPPAHDAGATSGVHDAVARERIAVEVVGSGPDVILIPGLSSSPDVWKDTVAALPGYRYHLVHVNGFAGSAPGANANGPFLHPVAHSIAEYIETNHLKAPALVGHSLGGSLALQVAEHHPDLVGKLMIVDMLPFMGVMVGGPAATPDSVKPAATAMRSGIAASQGEARKATIEKTIATMVKTESQRPRAVAHSLASDPAVSAQAMYDLITTDLRTDLPKYKGPMEILWVYPPNAPVAEPIYKQFFVASFAGAPQAVVKQIPNSYHFIMWDNPAAFQAELKAFLGE